MKITKQHWLTHLTKNHPLLIAGPCSAETEEQVLQTAHQLKNTHVSIFRAGIWKPRTRPGNFEGIGEIGFEWLQRVKEETNLLTAVEVANPVHATLALKYDVDVFWIGARTTVNPFLVQEIAESLRGVDKIVLIKNPVNPDLALWMGAIERLKKANIHKLGAIHRGFSTYKKNKYRNIPEWQLPIELQTKLPDLPLICDPSHIAGKRDLIFDVSQTALNLNFDGLMIETHYNPDNAWSDVAQQITPATLLQMMDTLKIRKQTTDETGYKNELSTLRAKIDIMDNQLIEILGKRMRIADDIGLLKNEKNVAILQPERWKKILNKMTIQGKHEQLSEEFILRLYRAIHQESINHQENVIKNLPKS